MPEAPQDPHPDELYSDLDMLVDMVKDAKQGEQAILRHLDSLKAKLDRFVHRRRTDSEGGSAA